MAKRSKKDVLVTKTNPKKLSPLTKETWKVFERDGSFSHTDIMSAMCDLHDELKIPQVIEIPIDFSSNLTDEQITRLLPILTSVVRMKAYDVDNVREWLECRNREPLTAKNIGLLSYLLYLLSSESYICQNWQHVASERKVFCSRNGKTLTRIDFAAALAKLKKRTEKKPDEEIFDAVMGLKG